jgi:Tol biopolymer transport system component
MKMKLWLLFCLFLAACSGGNVPTPEAGKTGEALAATNAGETLPWDGKGLSGQLVLIQYSEGTSKLFRFNLATGEETLLFQVPEKGWLSGAEVSPDGERILMAYSPPPEDGVQLGYTGLYWIPAGGSENPEPLLERSDPLESYFNPTWSPDGKYVYFAHLYQSDPEEQIYSYAVERVDSEGQIESLVQDAIWPRLSPDGSKLAYLSVNPITLENHLYTANPDGTDPAAVLPPGTFPAVDAHLFFPDGDTILFSAVNPQPASPDSWLDRLLGVRTALAHNVPSDWYTVSAAGGESQRLTNLNDTGMFADLSPDGSRVAFISATGFFIMNTDGSDLFRVSSQVFIGTLDWIP